MSLRDVSKRLEDTLFNVCLDHAEPEPPKALRSYKTSAGFVKGFQRALDREDDLLRSVCIFYAQSNQIRFDLNEIQWWLLRGRVVAAYRLCQTLDPIQIHHIRPVWETQESDSVLISWLLINYWDLHAEMEWGKDLMLWFYQNPPQNA